MPPSRQSPPGGRCLPDSFMYRSGRHPSFPLSGLVIFGKGLFTFSLLLHEAVGNGRQDDADDLETSNSVELLARHDGDYSGLPTTSRRSSEPVREMGTDRGGFHRSPLLVGTSSGTPLASCPSSWPQPGAARPMAVSAQLKKKSLSAQVGWARSTSSSRDDTEQDVKPHDEQFEIAGPESTDEYLRTS